MGSDGVDELFSQFSGSHVLNGAPAASRGSREPPLKRAKTVLDVRPEPSDDQTVNPPVGYQDVIIETYEGETNCLHECVRPFVASDLAAEGKEKEPTKSSVPASSRPPAREFPYTLDPFQQTAVQCLEAGESVLVSAHTSAGKTTVAEYAIAMGLRDKQRVIYTSPIKALSNQKYRDLSNMYGNEVGLLTGDVSLNPSASVIVMTTEILRSMLYRGSEMVREMKWVIFDEIHYMRDRDRGVVWEETIILLPDTVRLVFLSATIPNAREFTEWICRIKHQPCHAIYTDYRPVPLQHYLFPIGGDGVHLVMDETKHFREDQFHKAVAELARVNDTLTTGVKPKGKKTVSDIEKIVLMCHERNYTPLIVFAFSKREVEANALRLKNVTLTNREEEELIETVFNNAMDTLGEDRHLPQITCMLPLLKRGIGLHHGGLLPIVKEVIEILFQESLVKVLFSTETFSMGVNMPAKTVVFTKLKKWDGTTFRMISPGEYIQMSGRAGRRGLDSRGLSIIMLDEQLESDVARELFLGEPLRITSQFHLGYNMLLNLLRVEGANPEYMIQRSFYQFQQDKATLQLEEKKARIDEQLEAWSDVSEVIASDEEKSSLPVDLELNASVAQYYSTQHSLTQCKKELRDMMMQPKYVLRFLQVGRVVHVHDLSGRDKGYGIVAQPVQKQRLVGPKPGAKPADGTPTLPPEKLHDTQFVVPVILKCDANVLNGATGGSVAEDETPSAASVWEIVTCTLPMLYDVTQVIANVPVNVTTSPEARGAVGDILGKIAKQLNHSFPTLDPVKHMKIDSSRVVELQREIKELEGTLEDHPLSKHPLLPKLYARFEERLKLTTEKQQLEHTLEAQKHLVMKDDLRAMRRVLRKLDYLDDQNIVTLKGRAACEVSSVDELVMCELLFQNVFHRLETNYLAATLSCFVFEEKSDEAPPSDPKLLLAYERVREMARRVAEVSLDAKLPICIDDYVDKFKPVLMDIVLKWMQGAKFADLGISEDLFEGSVVRAMRRLEELLRQLTSAAKSIGEQELEARLSEAIVKMRRGIVFSASLYL